MVIYLSLLITLRFTLTYSSAFSVIFFSTIYNHLLFAHILDWFVLSALGHPNHMRYLFK